jgi:hypothetical protein
VVGVPRSGRCRNYLILQPKPFGEASLDSEKLERFYQKFGFVIFQQIPVVLMARSPVVSAW